jgi:SAM-dependent methyltransferase
MIRRSSRPDFSRRSRAPEQMDDWSVGGSSLRRALEELRLANRMLGGSSALMSVLGPHLLRERGRPVRLIDLGTGVADLPERIVRWAHRRGIHADVLGIDANPATVEYATGALDRRLPPALRRRVRVECADALSLSGYEDAFDVAMASTFMHHLADSQAAELLRLMQRLSRRGIVVSDLHRHPLAYHGLRVASAVLSRSPMFRHDGPVSVLRGFTRDELARLAYRANLANARVRWHWAFRWTLTTLETP